MNEKHLRHRADYMAADGFFLALELFTQHGIPSESDDTVGMLKALVMEALILVDSPADAVAVAERRRGSSFTEEEMEKAQREADTVTFQMRMNHRETARAILRSLQRDGLDVGMSPEDPETE